MNKKNLIRLLPSLLSLLIFGIAIYAISHELQQYKMQEVWHSLISIPAQFLLLAVGLTCLNYIIMTGYDAVALRYIHHHLSFRKTMLVGIITPAISNTVGLALLSSSAIRYRFYTAYGLSVSEIAQIITFCNLSFWLGLFTTGSLFFIMEPLKIPQLLYLPFKSVHPIGFIFLSIILAYLFATVLSRKQIQIGKFKIPNISLGLTVAQISIATFDWILAGTIFYVILPVSDSLYFSGIFGIYLLAQLAGIISNVPGGLGVFETVILLLLSHSIPSIQLFGSLVAYRVIYYLFPLIVAVLLFSLYEYFARSHFKKRN